MGSTYFSFYEFYFYSTLYYIYIYIYSDFSSDYGFTFSPNYFQYVQVFAFNQLLTIMSQSVTLPEMGGTL